MSRGLGKRQQHILDVISDGAWHDVRLISYPDAPRIDIKDHGPHNISTRPYVVSEGSKVSVTNTGLHRSTMQAVRSLRRAGLVETMRKNGTGEPVMVRITPPTQ